MPDYDDPTAHPNHVPIFVFGGLAALALTLGWLI
jgi:hypothetical protein